MCLLVARSVKSMEVSSFGTPRLQPASFQSFLGIDLDLDHKTVWAECVCVMMFVCLCVLRWSSTSWYWFWSWSWYVDVLSFVFYVFVCCVYFDILPWYRWRFKMYDVFCVSSCVVYSWRWCVDVLMCWCVLMCVDEFHLTLMFDVFCFVFCFLFCFL